MYVEEMRKSVINFMFLSIIGLLVYLFPVFFSEGTGKFLDHVDLVTIESGISTMVLLIIFNVLMIKKLRRSIKYSAQIYKKTITKTNLIWIYMYIFMILVLAFGSGWYCPISNCTSFGDNSLLYTFVFIFSTTIYSFVGFIIIMSLSFFIAGKLISLHIIEKLKRNKIILFIVIIILIILLLLPIFSHFDIIPAISIKSLIK